MVDGDLCFVFVMIIFFEQNVLIKSFCLIVVWVVNGEGVVEVYVQGIVMDGIWIYVLQVVCILVIVWGVWLGYVYYWYVVMVVMQYVMFEDIFLGGDVFDKDELFFQFLVLMFEYFIGFDIVFLLFWKNIVLFMVIDIL